MKLKWIIFFIFLISLISVNAKLQERFDLNNNLIPYTIESFDDGSIYQIFGDGTINKVNNDFNLFSVFTSSNIDFLNKKCIGNPDGMIFTIPPKNINAKCLATTIADRSRCVETGYSNPVPCVKTDIKPLNPQPKPSTNPSCTFPYSSLNECLQCKKVKEEECVNDRIYVPSYSNGGCFRSKTDKSCTQIIQYIEGKIYCFGNGFVDKWTNGKPVNIDGKKQCSEFGDYINDCAIDLTENTPNYGNSIDEVCKKKSQPIVASKNCNELGGILISSFLINSHDCSGLSADYISVSSIDSQSGNICCIKKIIIPPLPTPITTCPEGQWICEGNGILSQCQNNINLDKEICPSSQCQVKSIYSANKDNLCTKDVLKTTCIHQGTTFKIGDNVGWTCSTLDESTRISQVVTAINADGSCMVQLSGKEKCGNFKFKQKICEQGFCVEPQSIPLNGSNEGLTFKEIQEATNEELFLNSCTSKSECSSNRCLTFNSLIAKDILTEKDVENILDKVEGQDYLKALTTGAFIGGGVCAATGIGLIITPLCAVGGSIFGFLTEITIDAWTKKDPREIGICIKEEKKDEDTGEDEKLWEQINPCEWGKQLDKKNGCIIGWGIVGFILLIIFFARPK